ncbi:oxidoreductase [Aspergillus cavernicola]|uniref:Oxidoreductase n=1 Tax=Aspergillus cavernicola TaxID=176166 RepID=A0ABR4IWZ2_9EURO
MANIRLAGGIAVATGAASGIGKETALAFAGVELPGSFRAVSVQADVTDEASVAQIVETAVKEFGRVDYCLHAAGATRTEHLDIEVFDKTIATNARGTMLVLRAVSAAMAQQEPRTHQSHRHSTSTRSLGRGSIVVISSINGTIAAPGTAYSASKYAAIGIAKTAAVDNVDNHIRVNTICPSWTDTEMMQASLKRYSPLAKMIEALSPLKRAALPDEVADSAVFLCSPAASYINGTSLVVDAGLTLPALRNNILSSGYWP